ncbi:MAG TPA: cytochrome c oxidase subunit 3 [Rectinemataceae bacterium]|nr:cytochrome c oxidase subunit 3 [Rectinemataceae bacterium]
MSDTHASTGASPESLRFQEERGKVGMWLFICTEVLLFGGLFLLYSVYRYKHHVDFHAASSDLSRFAGTLNTIVLITSSLTAALAVHALGEGAVDRAKLFLRVTILFGLTFLVVKSFEWGAKFEHGLYPNAPVLLGMPKGQILFFGLYFSMTGLHAVHVIVGMSIFGWVLGHLGSTVTPSKPVVLENATLFWHLVDVIWIFLFPLFYLIS